MCHKEYSFFFVRAFGLNWVLGIGYWESGFFCYHLSLENSVSSLKKGGKNYNF